MQNVPGMSDIGQPFRQRGMKIIKGENGIGAKNTNEAMQFEFHSSCPKTPWQERNCPDLARTKLWKSRLRAALT